MATFNPIELGLVLGIVGIFAAVATPAIMIAMERKNYAIHLANLRQLGIALIIEASENPENRLAATSDGEHEAKTSTEVFNYLIKRGVLKEKNLVYTPANGKIAPSATLEPDFSADNVCVNYMVNPTHGKIKGVEYNIDAYEHLPLLWSSGNEPFVVKSGATLKILSTNVQKQTGVAVYFCNNTAIFRRPVHDDNRQMCIRNFVPEKFQGGTETFAELKP